MFSILPLAGSIIQPGLNSLSSLNFLKSSPSLHWLTVVAAEFESAITLIVGSAP